MCLLLADPRCSLPLEEGDGTGSDKKWYFDGSICKPFQYTGSGGNRNNFDGKWRCKKTCEFRKFKHLI